MTNLSQDQRMYGSIHVAQYLVQKTPIHKQMQFILISIYSFLC